MTDLGEAGWDYVDCIGLAQDRNRWRGLVNSVLNLGFHELHGKLSNGITGGLSSSAQLHRVSLLVKQRNLSTVTSEDDQKVKLWACLLYFTTDS
jgi:hypothetical protein